VSGHTPMPWAYRPDQCDDWGVVRGGPVGDFGQGFICQARDPLVLSEDQLTAHRIAGTDPWEANARRIVAAVNGTSTLSNEALEAGVVDKLVEALEAVELARHSDEPCHWQAATDLTNAATSLARGEHA